MSEDAKKQDPYRIPYREQSSYRRLDDVQTRGFPEKFEVLRKDLGSTTAFMVVELQELKRIRGWLGWIFLLLLLGIVVQLLSACSLGALTLVSGLEEALQ